MSTGVTFTDGITRFVRFERTVAEGWRFTWADRSFMAWRDPAGFAHRDWVLYEYDGPRDAARPFQGSPSKIVEDNLASRAECVEAAARSAR